MTYARGFEIAYQKWVEKRRAEGTAEGMINSINALTRAQFGVDVFAPEVSERLSKLNKQQLDEFTAKMFELQDLGKMIAYLNNFRP